MNYVLSSTSGAFGEMIATAAGKFASFFATAGERAALYIQYRKTVAELSKLTSRELADLGLNASNLRSAALEAVYG